MSTFRGVNKVLNELLLLRMQMDDAIQLFMFQFVTELYTLDDPL